MRRQGEVGRALKAARPGRDGQAGVAAWRARRRMAATRRARPDAGRGAGAGERTAAQRQAGPAYAAGPKRRQQPSKEKWDFSSYFQIFFHSNKILNYFKAVSKVGVKMKVVPFFKIYNFSFMTKVKF